VSLQVDEPCAAVELRVDGLDEPWDGLALLVLGLDDDDASHWLWVLCGPPADDNGVAGVVEVEDLEWDGWLRALASHELLAGGEGWAIELCSC
jgi:hypothetical protein